MPVGERRSSNPLITKSQTMLVFYPGVVSRDSVQIALTYAALNELDVTAADIQIAYLQAPSSKKYYANHQHWTNE